MLAWGVRTIESSETEEARFGPKTPDLEKKNQISCIMSRFGVKKKQVKKGQIGK
jgi:hypothetical protein